MARMIPKLGPVVNDSIVAEPTLYAALSKQLSDDFVVIHSLPWLGQVATSFDGRPVPTGEIDFLLLHPTLGILAIEVKGGRLKANRHNLVVLRTGQEIDPVNQVRRSVHALARWIKGSGGPAYRLGYAFAFPESDFRGRSVPPAFIETARKTLCFSSRDTRAIIFPCSGRLQRVSLRQSIKNWLKIIWRAEPVPPMRGDDPTCTTRSLDRKRIFLYNTNICSSVLRNRRRNEKKSRKEVKRNESQDV